MGKLGTLTIGQAPRADITPILDDVLDARLPRRHAGVLDGLSRAEIERGFAAEPGKPMLITKLLDGSAVVIDRARTEAAAQAKLAMLEAEGCSTILMLCTGHFESLRTETALLVEPDRILPPTVAALVQGPSSASSCRWRSRSLRRPGNGARSAAPRFMPPPRPMVGTGPLYPSPRAISPDAERRCC